jgi:hypothetical protein
MLDVENNQAVEKTKTVEVIPPFSRIKTKGFTQRSPLEEWGLWATTTPKTVAWLAAILTVKTKHTGSAI